MSRAILIFACIFSMCVKPPAYVSVSDKSVEAYASTISSKSLKVLSIGGFYLDEKVERLYLDLEFKGVLTKKEALKRLTKYVRGMLSHINSDKELRPYLIKRRFAVRDISISLSYVGMQGKSSQIHVENGDVVYSIYDKKTNSLERIQTRPFASEYAQ